MTRTGSPGARRGGRITSGGACDGRVAVLMAVRIGRRAARWRHPTKERPSSPPSLRLRPRERQRAPTRSRAAGWAAAAATGAAACGLRRGGGGARTCGRRVGALGAARLLAAARETHAHARGRRIRRLDDLGHARGLVLLVDLQHQRRPDRQRLAEDDERAGVGAIAHLRRPTDDHPAVSNLRRAIHESDTNLAGVLPGTRKLLADRDRPARGLSDRRRRLLLGAPARGRARAASSVFILGWDIDSRARLNPGTAEAPLTLLAFLNESWPAARAARVRAGLGFLGAVYTLEREPLPTYRFAWNGHPRLSFQLDDAHPFGASHHQKVVVVDDALAFCGRAGSDHPALGHARAPRARARPRRPGRPPLPADARRADDGRRRGGRRAGRARARPLARCDRAARRRRRRRRPGRRSCGRTRSRPTSTTRRSASPAPCRRSATRPAVQEMTGDRARRRSPPRARCIYIENQYLTSAAVGAALARRLAEPEGPEVVAVLPREEHGWLEQSSMGVLRARLLRHLRDQRPPRPPAALLPDDPRPRRARLHERPRQGDDRRRPLGARRAPPTSATDRWASTPSATWCWTPIWTPGSAPRSRRSATGCSPSISTATRWRSRTRWPARGSLIARRRVAGAAGPASLGAAARPHRRRRGAGRRTPPRIRRRPGVPRRPRLRSRTAGARRAAGDARSRGSPAARPPIAGRLGPGDRGVAGGRRDLAADAAPDAAGRGPRRRARPRASAGTRRRRSPSSPRYLGGTLVFFPITLLLGGTALLFPAPTAIAYCMAGALAAAMTTYGIGRLVGRFRPRWLERPRLQRISRQLRRRGMLAVIAARMLPVGNFSLINITAGALGIPFRDYMLGNAIGLLPGVLALTVFADRIGATVRHPHAEQPDRAGAGRGRDRRGAVVAQAPDREAKMTAETARRRRIESAAGRVVQHPRLRRRRRPARPGPRRGRAARDRRRHRRPARGRRPPRRDQRVDADAIPRGHAGASCDRRADPAAPRRSLRQRALDPPPGAGRPPRRSDRVPTRAAGRAGRRPGRRRRRRARGRHPPGPAARRTADAGPPAPRHAGREPGATWSSCAATSTNGSRSGGRCAGCMRASEERASVATFPAAFPVFALDRIWVNPRGALTALAAHASPSARVASDHLPVTADIRLGSS